VKIVFLGNFEPVHSTESHHKWTWEKLGHQVVALQENKTTTDAVVAACKDAQLFQWTHTHGFVPGGTILLTEMLDRIHGLGVKTFSYHLDVFWLLNQWDKREDNIGKHPSWRVQHFFSTDGSHDQAKWKSRGVNHHWLPPGVVESGCFEGSFQPSLACDVGFIGSVNYHPEHSFRGIMVQALRNRYGSRFRAFQGHRERGLNDLYASCKVTVGDHCFAGRPRYWSDRLPEACGRGGFVIYPLVEGLTIPTVTYLPQNLPDLFTKIDHYLERPEKREVIRKSCHEHVKKFDTYTQRLQEILKVMDVA
jgi:glycosyl transferase family 1